MSKQRDDAPPLAPADPTGAMPADATEMLRASEQRFRDLFEEAPIAHIYEDTDSRFVSANRAAMTLLGLRPEEVRGTLGLSLVAPTEETQRRVRAAIASIQRGEERAAIELELRRKDDGRPVWVQWWSKPDPDGKYTRTMLVDVTARVLAERERNRLQQQNLYLQEEIKSESNFEEEVLSKGVDRVLGARWSRGAKPSRSDPLHRSPVTVTAPENRSGWFPRRSAVPSRTAPHGAI